MRRHLIRLASLLLLVASPGVDPAVAQLPDPAGAVPEAGGPGELADGVGDAAEAAGAVAGEAAGTATQTLDRAGAASGLLLGEIGDEAVALLDRLGLALPGDLGGLLAGEAGLLFDRALAGDGAPAGEAEFVPGEVLVLRPSTQLLQAVQADGFRLLSVERFEDLGATVARLAVPEGVAAAEARGLLAGLPERPVVTLNGLYRRDQAQWVVPQETIWGQVGWQERCAAPVGIGVVDTAIDPAVAGAAAGIEQRDVRDDGGGATAGEHGSAVAAILASGVAERPGLLRDSRLLVAAAFPADLSGPADTLAMLRALDWLSGRDVAVINFSLSGPRNDILGEALTLLDRQGVSLVAAVGSGAAGAGPRLPAGHPAVLGVTALGPDDVALAAAARGPVVDLAAPGVAVPTLGTGGQPIRATGTSFAAPFVTAAVALLAARGLEPAEIRERLTASGRDLGAPGRDDVHGHGALVAPGCPALASSG
mgnify:CR=1 FL=1